MYSLALPRTYTHLVVYSSIPETMNVDLNQLVDEGYYAAPKAVEKVNNQR